MYESSEDEMPISNKRQTMWQCSNHQVYCRSCESEHNFTICNQCLKADKFIQLMITDMEDGILKVRRAILNLMAMHEL